MTSETPEKKQTLQDFEAPPNQLADAVLRLIWHEQHISRAEIARQASLSRSTVSEIVGNLLKRELVTEVGSGPSSGGRRPIVLEFQDNTRVILGVDMGAGHVSVALTDLRGNVLAWEEKEHPVRTDPKGTRALIFQLCEACLAKRGQGNRGLVGIGIAVPSPVDPEHPGDLSEVVLPAWQAHAGFEELSTHYGVPVMVDNDANLGALSEAWWGAGVNVANLIYIKVATGIGSGHVINGEIYRGATGFAGEIGHLPIDPNGPPCVCGLQGCLVTFVGAAALTARAESLLHEFPKSSLVGQNLTIEAIENAALAGDPLAVQVAEEAAEHLGIAMTGVINLMNPAMVIVGGGLARLGDLILHKVREMAQGRTLMHSLTASKIRVSDLGPQSIAVGAATLVLKAALEDSRLFPDPAELMERQT